MAEIKTRTVCQEVPIEPTVRLARQDTLELVLTRRPGEELSFLGDDPPTRCVWEDDVQVVYITASTTPPPSRRKKVEKDSDGAAGAGCACLLFLIAVLMLLTIAVLAMAGVITPVLQTTVS